MGRQIISGHGRAGFSAGFCRRGDFEVRTVGHNHVAPFGGVDDVGGGDQIWVVGWTRKIVSQSARTMEIVVGVGVHDAGDSVTEIDHL